MQTARSGLSLLAIVAGANLLLGTPSVGARDPDSQLDKQMQERLQVAQKLYLATEAAFGAQTVTLAQLIDARREWLAAELELTAGAGALNVIKKHVGLAQELEKKIQVLAAAGARGGEPEKYLAARLERVKLEIELERRVKAAQAKPQ